jgi:pimeloyl-ACP methyl ester carboxylesterase
MAAVRPAASGATVVEFTLPTGQVVRGQRWGDGANVAILIHAPGEDLDAWGDLPAELVGDGLPTVAVDLPGHGLSDDPWMPACLAATIRALADHFRGGGTERIFLVAAGVSALVALRAGPTSGIAALVALSPSGADAATDTDGSRSGSLPRLILVGAGDAESFAAARRLFGRAAGWAVLSTLPTAEQGTRLLAGDWGRQAREQIVAFLRDYRMFGACR